MRTEGGALIFVFQYSHMHCIFGATKYVYVPHFALLKIQPYIRILGTHKPLE